MPGVPRAPRAAEGLGQRRAAARAGARGLARGGRWTGGEQGREAIELGGFLFGRGL